MSIKANDLTLKDDFNSDGKLLSLKPRYELMKETCKTARWLSIHFTFTFEKEIFRKLRIEKTANSLHRSYCGDLLRLYEFLLDVKLSPSLRSGFHFYLGIRYTLAY